MVNSGITVVDLAGVWRRQALANAISAECDIRVQIFYPNICVSSYLSLDRSYIGAYYYTIFCLF